MSTLKKLSVLFFTFFKIGLVTFGGGLAMLPILEREVVERKHWISSETLMDYFTIGQATPGIIAVNVATFIGFNECGVLGGCIATLGVVTPSIIIITLIALFLADFSSILWIKKALLGINIVVAALLTKIVVKFHKVIFKNPVTVVLFVLSFVLISFFKVNTVSVIAGGIIIGFIYYIISFKRKEL